MAKRKFGEKSEMLYRVAKFEVRPTTKEFSVLLAISELLKALFNSALAERQKAFAEHFAPLYERLKSVGTEDPAIIKQELKEAYRDENKNITLFGQINALTAKRASDELFAGVPRSWQEETLDMLDSSYKSFMSLRKKGDPDARPPRARGENFFQKIPGRFGFKVTDGQFMLSCGGGRKISFPIPEHQQKELVRAVAFKKFELYRDERRLDQPGRFWISVAYELRKPEVTFFDPERACYIALGASSIGVISPYEEEVLKLWRSDKHWLPLIESVEQAMKAKTKGSLAWQRLEQSRKRMYQISSRQRLQDEREVVQYLLKKHGNHFVVTDLVVRSKIGKLADSEKSERGGPLGLNWAAQNTGSLGRLVLQLEEKVKEFKGSVRKHKPILDQGPSGIGHENKLWMAQKLRESFLATQRVSVA